MAGLSQRCVQRKERNMKCGWLQVQSDCIGDRLGVTQTQSDLLGTVSQRKTLLEAKLALARKHNLADGTGRRSPVPSMSTFLFITATVIMTSIHV